MSTETTESKPVSAEQLAKLKAKYGELFTLTISRADGQPAWTGHLRGMDRNTYSATMKVIEQDELQGAEVMLLNLHVAGDDPQEVINNFSMLRTASIRMAGMLELRAGELKKN